MRYWLTVIVILAFVAPVIAVFLQDFLTWIYFKFIWCHPPLPIIVHTFDDDDDDDDDDPDMNERQP